MASFWTRVADRLSWWDRKGERERREQREREVQQRQAQSQASQSPSLRVSNAQPTQRVVVNQPQTPKTQRPEDLFKDLNQSLNIGNRPNNVVDPNRSRIEPTPTLKPGSVVKPTQRLKVGNQYVDEIPDSPEIILNRALDRGDSWEKIARDNNYDLDKVREYSQATRPNYGIKVEKPKQGFFNKIRDVFDANTEADKYRRYRGNVEKGENKDITLRDPGNIVSRTPIIGNVTKMINTGYRQLGQIDNAIEGQILTKMQNDVTKDLIAAQKRGDRVAYEEAKRKLDILAGKIRENSGEQEGLNSKFKKNSGGIFNAGTLYDEEAARTGDAKTALTDIALPTAVTMLDLYTLGKGNQLSEVVKRGGLPALSSQKANLAKMAVGNYASGDLGARAEGATGWDPILSGGINTVLGTVPDVAVPALTRSFRNRLIPSFLRRGRVNPRDVVEELDDAAIAASAEAANRAMTPRPIPVTRNIPVDVVEGIGENIRVRDLTEPGRLIQEIGGDASVATPNPLIRRAAEEVRENTIRDAAFEQARNVRRSDPTIDGVIPQQTDRFVLNPEAVKSAQDEMIDSYADMLRKMGEGNGVDITPDGRRVSNNVRFGDTKGKRMTKAMWREEAERQLRAGKAEPEIQKAFNDAADPEVQSMLSKGDTGEEMPQGRPIEVKQATSIPVDEVDMPINAPDTPGQVRATTARAPMAEKSQAVANAPVVNTPSLPREVQEVLDNPKQFSKRQVDAARNQRKLARQMAKTQEQTAEAVQRLEAAKGATTPQSEGIAPTGEFARGRYGAYQKASAATEAAAGEREMAYRSVDDLISEVGMKESFTSGDRRRINAALNNLIKADPDNIEARTLLRKLQGRSRTELGQSLALLPRVIRRSADADTLVGRWERKIGNVLDDPSALSGETLARVQRANDEFTLARDTANQLEEQFRRTGSKADYEAWEKAYKAAREADTNAKFIEADAARDVLKGQRGAGVTKVIDDLKKEADVNTMDSITASMLSGTGTGFRNTFGTELAGIENRLLANTRAKITNKLFGQNVGGFDRGGAKFGRKYGAVKLVRDAQRRATIGGKNPIEWAKNWSTTINSGGESSLQSQVYSRLAKYYKNQFAEQGIKGADLDMRMRHAMLTDPDGIGTVFMDAAMKSSGLSGIFSKGQKLESWIADGIGRHTDSRVAKAGAKLMTRLLVGFPTATGNFLAQSGKRLAMGLPSFLESGYRAAKGDKMGAALAFERALKEAGSGAAITGLGVMLGSQGLISGAYPDDPDERARWEREGISENSININGAWYPIPQGAGMLGLPLMFGAAIGREGDSNESVKDFFNPKNFSKLLPTDQIQGFLNMASGNGAPQDLKNTIASGVRAGTPLGSLWNQLAKSFDDTKNDTTTKDFWSNTFDAILGSNPITNSLFDIPDKLDDAGNPISNPNALELAFGATSATQDRGVQRSAEISDRIQSQINQIDQYGLLNDPNMDGVLEGTALEAYNKLKAGRQLDESDIKALNKGLVKGVSSEGTDTAYLERGEYDTNLAVLKLKRDLMQADKTTKPSSLEDIDTAIKRGEVYKEHQIPYSDISAYKSIGVEEWRKMGDPDSEEYDPDTYQRLWAIDELMAKAGVSYRKGKKDQQKYYLAEKKGRGRGSGSNLGSDFGRLKGFDFAPQVRQYETIEQRAGQIPIIRTVRPNIVHKISSS